MSAVTAADLNFEPRRGRYHLVATVGYSVGEEGSSPQYASFSMLDMVERREVLRWAPMTLAQALVRRPLLVERVAMENDLDRHHDAQGHPLPPLGDLLPVERRPTAAPSA